MWIMTDIGFFSIVQKPGDKIDGMLTVRARVKSDLVALREKYLPSLGEVIDRAGTDYSYRARAPRADVSEAIQKLTMAIDYDNYKNAVSERQGHDRAKAYGKVWSALYNLESSR